MWSRTWYLLSVTSTPPFTGTAATNTTADRCVLLLLPACAAAAAAAAAASAEVENICTSEGVVEGGGKFTKKKNVGFSMSPTRLGEAESNTFFV